jgi:uncharacterized protein YcfJ
MKTMIRTGAAAAAFTALLGAAASAEAAQYATVVSATPVNASVAVPRRDCVQGEQIVQQPPSGAGALVGAITGGVIGNQFGHGFGKAAATGLGVVAGSAIGNNVEASANPPTAVPVQHCRTVTGYDSRIVGYDVVYEYNGQRYTTRLPHDPGPRLAIDIRPAGGAALEQAAPPVSSRAAPQAYAGAPAYAEPAPSDGDAPIYYDEPAPVYGARYYGPAPAYYGAPYYAPSFIGPAIGLGIGYWIGSTWHHGYRYGGYYGGHHWH